jgi:Family of unknown function (DUF6869)
MAAMNDADLIAGYVLRANTRRQPGGAGGDQFSEALDSLIQYDPERAWPLMCEIIGQITDDGALAFAAAGPLENLLVRHPLFIDRVESLARQDPHFRHALSGVWIDGEIGRRLDALLGNEPRH